MIVMVIVAVLLTPIQSILLTGQPAKAAQSDLTASLSAAGESFAPSSFTDLTTETFDSINSLAAGTTLAVGTIGDLNSGTISAQSGGTYASPTNTTYTIGSTARATDVAAWYGGSGGSGRFPYVGSSNASTSVVGGMTITLNDIAGVSPADNTYRYVGFWWSGGNSPNIVRLMNNGVAQATFTTVNLLGQLGSAPSPRVSDDYFGNPNSAYNSDDVTCPSGNNCSTVGQAEPYAYVNLRYSPGFDEIQFLGRGFEFDTISIRRFVPASDAGEVAIVGSGVVSSCSAFSDTNAQYVLRNGSFEDNYLTASTGTASAPLSGVTTSNTTTDIAKWVRYNSGPYQFSNFYDSGSSNPNRIPFWLTSASDDKIELQRQVSGSESSAARNGSLYYDLYGPRPADGNVHAEINANERAALFQDIKTTSGEKITWSIKHRGRYFGSGSTTQASSTTSDDKDKFEILIGPASGTLVSQTPSRKKLPDVVWNSSNATYANNAFTTFTTSTTGHTAGTMYTRLEDGWVLYTGTYTVPANQTTTRFSFSSRGTGTVGNLIDDIGFDPIIACPRSVTMERSPTATFNYNPLTNSQISGYTYPETTTLTSVSVNGGSGTATADTSNGNITLSSNTVGTFQVLYTITDVNNQTSTSTITVTVNDIPVVTSCSAFNDDNAQYVLRNGSFEDDFFTNAAGTSSESLATTSRWNNTWMTLSDADSGSANRIPFWKTTASDNQVELQRQVAGLEARADRNGSDWDIYFARPAQGSVHAEINANQQADLYQDIKTTEGEKITWSIKHRGRFFSSDATTFASSTASNDRDKFEILIGPAGGTLTRQVPARQKRPDEIWNTTDATYLNNAFTTFTTPTTGHTTGTMYTKLEDGWILYTGTYTVPSNQTTTRFSFNSRGTGSVGNLIDDIGFDPIMACPRNVTIQKSASSTYTYNPLTNSQISGYTYPDTTEVSELSVQSGTGTATLNSSTGDISLSSNTVGTFQVLYTLTDINNQSSSSTINVTVEDAAAEFPNLVLVDPRQNQISLPSVTLSGSTNAMVCLRQVANISGGTLSGSATLTVGRSSATSNVTLTESSNLWNVRGTRNQVQSQIPSVTISGLNGGSLAVTDSKFVRIGISAATEFGTGHCFLSSSRIVEIKPVRLGSNIERNVVIE